ncbi:unnamed protein product [Chrysoparadoxa australica]
MLWKLSQRVYAPAVRLAGKERGAFSSASGDMQAKLQKWHSALDKLDAAAKDSMMPEEPLTTLQNMKRANLWREQIEVLRSLEKEVLAPPQPYSLVTAIEVCGKRGKWANAVDDIHATKEASIVA